MHHPLQLRVGDRLRHQRRLEPARYGAGAARGTRIRAGARPARERPRVLLGRSLLAPGRDALRGDETGAAYRCVTGATILSHPIPAAKMRTGGGTPGARPLEAPDEPRQLAGPRARPASPTAAPMY